MSTAADRYLSTDRPNLHHKRDVWSLENNFLPALKALSACMCADPDSRLHAVSIEVTGGGIAYLSASNGHVLLTLEIMLPNPGEVDTATRTTFTGQSIKRFISTKGYAPLDVCEFPNDYPDVRQVVPKEFSEAHPRIGINANYIDTLSKVLRAFSLVGKTRMTPVAMQHNGPMSPMLFSFDSDSDPVIAGSLTVMPIRLDN